MVIVWKGIGIIVPILLVAIGYIVSLFYEDKTLGNTNLLGWAFFYSSIIFILVGLAVALPSEEEKSKTGKKLTLWRHTFFFLPILFWGLIFLILCIYLLLIYNPNPVFKFDEAKYNLEQTPSESTIIHFYNPSGDSIRYSIVDVNGEEEVADLAGYTSELVSSTGEKDECYLFGGRTLDGEFRMFIQPKDEKNYDKNKYRVIKEDGENIYMRKIQKPTIETNDVDDVWILVDSEYKLALIDVTNIYSNGKLKRDLINKVNWLEKIEQKYSGDDVIVVDKVHPQKDGTIKVISPNTAFTEEITAKTKIYFLLDYSSDEDLNKKYIAEEIIRLTTD
jgi:hypothetical protein